MLQMGVQAHDFCAFRGSRWGSKHTSFGNFRRSIQGTESTQIRVAGAPKSGRNLNLSYRVAGALKSGLHGCGAPKSELQGCRGTHSCRVLGCRGIEMPNSEKSTDPWVIRTKLPGHTFSHNLVPGRSDLLDTVVLSQTVFFLDQKKDEK